MWHTSQERLALLELLVRGKLRRRQSQAVAWDALAELPWTQRTGRREEIRLVEDRRRELAELLGRVWPTWSEALAELTARGLLPTLDGWAALEDARRAEGLPTLPDQLNRRTAAALTAPHSKATLTARRRAALGTTEPTHDGLVRLRTPRGVLARSPRGTLDLSSVADVLGEASLPERALREGIRLEGSIRAVLLVENQGPFCDLPAIDGWLFAHVAGWNTATVSTLLAQLPDILVVHFGDLDPNGVRIVQHLRQRRPDLRWFVPSFWRELIPASGQLTSWPADLDLCEAPPLVQELAARGLWLEQEPIVLDPRVPASLDAMLQSRDR